MNQDNGGIIGKINTPTTNVASGVWTLDSQFEAQSSSIWPLAFPQTTFTNSCRFDDGSSDNLTKTFSTDGTSHDIGTVSVWLKRSTLGAEQAIFTAGSTNRNFIRFESGDTLTFRSVADSFQLTTT